MRCVGGPDCDLFLRTLPLACQSESTIRADDFTALLRGSRAATLRWASTLQIRTMVEGILRREHAAP
jgi:hypothetical protein